MATRQSAPASPAGTSAGSRFRRSRKHNEETPGSAKKARRSVKIQIQQNKHQANDAARGFVKDTPTGNYTALFSLPSADVAFESIEAAINSSRLREELKSYCSSPILPARSARYASLCPHSMNVCVAGRAATIIKHCASRRCSSWILSATTSTRPTSLAGELILRRSQAVSLWKASRSLC